MVTEWFLTFAVWLGEMVIGMMPENGAAGIVNDGSNVVANVVSMGNGLSVWFPWAVIGAVGASVYAAWSALFIFKIVRQLLAHVPQFGGTG